MSIRLYYTIRLAILNLKMLIFVSKTLSSPRLTGRIIKSVKYVSSFVYSLEAPSIIVFLLQYSVLLFNSLIRSERVEWFKLQKQSQCNSTAWKKRTFSPFYKSGWENWEGAAKKQIVLISFRCQTLLMCESKETMNQNSGLQDDLSTYLRSIN